jgi:hypothetical protein
MYTKTSKLETQFIKDQNEGQGKMKDLFLKEKFGVEADQNFEITNEYLHFRQEVIA